MVTTNPVLPPRVPAPPSDGKPWTLDRLILNPGTALKALNRLIPRETKLLEANNRYLERARSTEGFLKNWKRSAMLAIESDARHRNELWRAKKALAEANEKIAKLTNPQRGSFSFHEMEAALCVWEWMLDDGALQVEPWRQAIGTVEARHASYEIGRYCLEICELGEKLAGPDAWSDVPFDWEVIPAICKTITFCEIGTYEYRDSNEEAAREALAAVEAFRNGSQATPELPPYVAPKPSLAQRVAKLREVFLSAGIWLVDALEQTTPAPISFRYRNYRGEVSVRNVLPLSIYYGSTEWHPEPQWLIAATDLDKNERRDFALKDINPSLPTWLEVENLKAAIEGECDGLAITDDQAEAILKWVIWQQE